jgi:hypothetical protein
VTGLAGVQVDRPVNRPFASNTYLLTRSHRLEAWRLHH